MKLLNIIVVLTLIAPALVGATARAMQDGAFRVTGIVPGDYWVVAVDGLEGREVAGDLQNPAMLDSLASRAQRITLGEGQSQILTLRLLRR